MTWWVVGGFTTCTTFPSRPSGTGNTPSRARCRTVSGEGGGGSSGADDSCSFLTSRVIVVVVTGAVVKSWQSWSLHWLRLVSTVVCSNVSGCRNSGCGSDGVAVLPVILV